MSPDEWLEFKSDFRTVPREIQQYLAAGIGVNVGPMTRLGDSEFTDFILMVVAMYRREERLFNALARLTPIRTFGKHNNAN